MIDKAIEELKIKKTIKDYALSPETIDIALKALDEKKAAEHLYWRSMKEEPVPEGQNEDMEYLMCVSGVEGNITYDHAILPEGFYEDGKWYIAGTVRRKLTIHAWMPYPDGYWKE